MHSPLSSAFASLDDAHARLRAAVAAVPPPLRGRRPSVDRWSVAEVLEHLALVERRFSIALGERIDEARARGLGAERATVQPLPEGIGRMLADRSAKRQAPEPSQPRGVLDEAAAWAAYEDARSQFRRTVGAADGFALSEVEHTHPFFGTLTVYQWVELVAAHAVRHADQIVEIGRELGAA